MSFGRVVYYKLRNRKSARIRKRQVVIIKIQKKIKITWILCFFRHVEITGASDRFIFTLRPSNLVSPGEIGFSAVQVNSKIPKNLLIIKI